MNYESILLAVKKVCSETDHSLAEMNRNDKHRFPSLDGWRGVSILLVLAGHLLPLGPHGWHMNSAVAATGMVIFFNLSGFLIITILLRDSNIINFLIRRFARIIPLAWLVLLISLFSISAEFDVYLRNFLFNANWEPMALTNVTSHFWSLCVEMQFYVSIAILICTFKKYAFWLLPVCSVIITAYRYYHDVGMAINTYYRIDEILAGCILAILFNGNHIVVKRFFCSFNPFYLFPLVILSAHPNPSIEFLQYFRPYFAMLMVGSSLFNEEREWWSEALNSHFLFYIASISYALYLIHGGLRFSWLGEGDTIVRYLKRPLLIGITFFLAHMSTFYYETFWISLGKKIITNRTLP